MRFHFGMLGAFSALIARAGSWYFRNVNKRGRESESYTLNKQGFNNLQEYFNEHHRTKDTDTPHANVSKTKL